MSVWRGRTLTLYGSFRLSLMPAVMSGIHSITNLHFSIVAIIMSIIIIIIIIIIAIINITIFKQP